MPLVVEGLVRCLCGADDRSDWTARLAAAGRAAITVRSLLLELRALPNLTDAMMSSAASSTLQHQVKSPIISFCSRIVALLAREAGPISTSNMAIV